MKTAIFTFSALLTVSCACSSDAHETTENSEKKSEKSAITAETALENTEKEQEVVAPKIVQLKGKFLREDDYGSSLYAVLLTIDGKTTAIDTVNACETIPASNFDQYDIPKTAKSACGGWWAGAGDYFYATIEKNKVVVYQGWQDETQTGNTYHWKAMKVKL